MAQILSWHDVLARWPHAREAAQEFCSQHKLEAHNSLCVILDEETQPVRLRCLLTASAARLVADQLRPHCSVKVSLIKREGKPGAHGFWVAMDVRCTDGQTLHRGLHAPVGADAISELRAWTQILAHAHDLLGRPFDVPVFATAPPPTPTAAIATQFATAVAPTASVAPQPSPASIAAAPTIPIAMPVARANSPNRGPKSVRPSPISRPLPEDLNALLVKARLLRLRPSCGDIRSQNLVRAINARRAAVVRAVMHAKGLPAFGADGHITRQVVARVLRQLITQHGPFPGNPEDEQAAISWLTEQLTLESVAGAA